MTLKDVDKNPKIRNRARCHISRRGRTLCGRDVTDTLQHQNEDLPVPGNICSICLENLQAIRIVRMA